jgi:hypothetical protein
MLRRLSKRRLARLEADIVLLDKRLAEMVSSDLELSRPLAASSKITVNMNCLRQSSYTADVSVTRAIRRTKGNWILEGWYM